MISSVLPDHMHIPRVVNATHVEPAHPFSSPHLRLSRGSKAATETEHCGKFDEHRKSLILKCFEMVNSGLKRFNMASDVLTWLSDVSNCSKNRFCSPGCSWHSHCTSHKVSSLRHPAEPYTSEAQGHPMGHPRGIPVPQCSVDLFGAVNGAGPFVVHVLSFVREFLEFEPFKD